jgi:GNAT superfamily N-acetyltransferase
VRPATPADAEQIAKLRVASWRHAYEGVVPAEWLAGMRPESSIPSWAELAKAPPPAALLVTADAHDQPVAFCAVSEARQRTDRHPTKRTAELCAIYADPAVLGKGAGSAVHEAALKWLTQQGFEHAVLWVLERNPLGIHFYRTKGWTPDGTQAELTIGGQPLSELRYARSLPPPNPSPNPASTHPIG